MKITKHFDTNPLSEEEDIVSYWKNLAEQEEIQFNDIDRIKTLEQVFNSTDMSTENITQFTKEILTYCKENLAKVEAFIPSPFLSKYLLDEVNTGKISFNDLAISFRRFLSNPLFPISED